MNLRRMHAVACAFVFALCAGLLPSARAQFSLAPYVQDVASDGLRVVWWSADEQAGIIEWGETPALGHKAMTRPQRCPAVGNRYRHEFHITGLRPDVTCHYRVTQGNATWASACMTAPGAETPFTFCVAADPESKAEDEARSRMHRAVLKQILAHQPRLLVYAGDLVHHGYPQEHWDTLWSQLVQATPAESLASQVPVYAALGNHDYCGFGGQIDGRKVPLYSQPWSEKGVERFQAYFTFPGNDRSPDDPCRERYYRLAVGPVSIIVLDTNNDSISTGDPATNWDAGRLERYPLHGENEPPEPGGQGHAPDIHGGLKDRPDSRQYAWLVETLRRSARESAFTFVVFHQAPYSSFVHGDPADEQSGHPLRKLDPLFHAYGVDAVFCGHDEAYERSVTRGGPDGRHEIQYYVLPTIADPAGLRLPEKKPVWQKGFSRYVYPLDHRYHGYLAVRVEPTGAGRHRATITPYYHDPARPNDVELHYPDLVTLTSDGSSQ